MITLYSTHCPKCRVLETKLKQKNVEYVECTDVDKMIELGITSAPCLDVDGKMLDFPSAVKWVNGR